MARVSHSTSKDLMFNHTLSLTPVDILSTHYEDELRTLVLAPTSFRRSIKKYGQTPA